eukprot:GHUV01024122.1.p2 GENE.GHUV01024122.1~~GHUV01024122.1.p2  ORF type:complete len:196 (+),score=44.40 GHUV01024122.1:593-1180(+)
MTLAFIRDLRLTCCAALADHSARMVVTGSVLRPQWQQFCCQILQSPHKASCCPTSRYPGLHTSSSYRQLTTVGCCHQYTISGYALARSLGPGTRMCSDLFEAGGQQFRLEVYPAGTLRTAAKAESIAAADITAWHRPILRLSSKTCAAQAMGWSNSTPGVLYLNTVVYTQQQYHGPWATNGLRLGTKAAVVLLTK